MRYINGRVKNYSQIGFQSVGVMKSASNGGALKGRLQVLHVHVLLAAPQGLSDVLHTPDGHTCLVHLNERLFHTALPAAIPLNNSGLKGEPFELVHLEGDIPGSGSEAAAVMAAAVTLELLIAFVPSRLSEFIRLGLQQLVEGFLYAASPQILELFIDYFLI